MPILGVVASSTRAGLSGPTGAYDALATVVVPSGGLSSITFGGIPTNYSHLQLRVLSGTNPAGYSTGMRFNGDTASNYYGHGMFGAGSSAGAFSLGAGTIATFSFSGTTTTAFSAAVVDILDYGSVNKNKTIRSLVGREDNTNGDMYLMSSSWSNTAAITEITIVAPSATFIQHSRFSLYGVK